MPDGYTAMFQDHLADCYKACGLSPAGAGQVANQQAPSSAADQAMLKTIIYDTTFEKSSVGTKPTPPPGTQTVPSKTNVVSMG